MSEVQCEEEFEEFDEETIRDLLSMTKSMDVEPNRNDLCYCMSGKKYKKCCMGKENQSDIKSVELKGFYLIPDTDPEVFQYGMSDEDYNIAADCYELLLTGGIEEDTEAIEFLNTLIKKYPDHSILNSMTALRYLVRGEKDACKEAIEDNLKKFPDNKISRLLLKFCEYESYTSQFFPKIGETIEKAPPQDADLTEAYEKEQISLTEFLLTLSLQIYENLFQEKLRKAMNLFDMMTNVLERMEWEEHVLLARMDQLIKIAKFTRKIKIFLANHSEGKGNPHGTIPVNA